MDAKKRYLVPAVLADLKEKMVFLGGPRQVGKTTFATKLIGTQLRSYAYSWDRVPERREALKGNWPADAKLIILDEFHKHTKWKTWIKGEYDTNKDRLNFFLTGSARLDLYRRGGDSLQGRYHYYRLHPFSVSELKNHLPVTEPSQELQFDAPFAVGDLNALLHFGGFPEPFIKQNERNLRRWHNEFLERFFREDIRDLTQIQDIGHLTLLADLLPEKVGSILSVNAIAQNLQVNFRTVANWIEVFERFYYCFRVAPFQSRLVASARKEKKLYLWDWSMIKDAGAQMENFTASHLLKFCHYMHDVQGWNVTLSYLRDTTGREVDFLVCHENKPWFAVEVKSEAIAPSRHLFYFRDKLAIPHCFQLTRTAGVDHIKDGMRIISIGKFLTALV